MADKKRTTYVTVHDDNGQGHTFGPDDDLPGWAKSKITNPAVYGEEVPAPAGSGPSEPEPVTAATAPPDTTPAPEPKPTAKRKTVRGRKAK